MSYCSLICTRDSFHPSDCSRVRWLDWENDYPLARAYWLQDPPLSQEDWEQNRAEGFRYCAIVEQEAIAALAAVWTYSSTHWEVVAVSTAPVFRRRGYGKAVVCFVTTHILELGRKATILTESRNVAMLKTAESVGFYHSDKRSALNARIGCVNWWVRNFLLVKISSFAFVECLIYKFTCRHRLCIKRDTLW